MARAFVLLQRERRHDHETRKRVLAGEEVVLNGEEPPKRIIPVQYSPEDPRPLVTTTAKVITFAILVIGAVVTLNWQLARSTFEQSVDSRFDRFELRLTKEYALAKDVITKDTYELRHTELIQRDAQLTERINELEKRMRDLENRLSLEKNGRR